MDDERAREERWEATQERLKTLLERHGAVGLDFRIDLVEGRFWWLRSDGSPALVASARVLLSYAPSSRSILMGWANPSLAPTAAVPEIEGAPARLTDCDADDGWRWAMRLGDACGADFLYRAPNAQTWLFLGLWGVRDATPGDALPTPQAPWPHVQRVLEALLGRHREGQDVGPVARNYGLSFVEERAHRGGPFEAPLRRVGERLVELADGDPDTLGEGLKALYAQIERLQAS
ncbi:MAG TPA: hypothetical protein VFS43_32875 [Polyangiaceae bacterium]|nr:hypothetical protein [Polyangiaceae bacterium]